MKNKMYTTEVKKNENIIVIEPNYKSGHNELFFQHKLNTRRQIIESKKYKKPKYKNKDIEY